MTQKRQWQWGGTYKAMGTEAPKFMLQEARPHTPGRKLHSSRKTNRLKTGRLKPNICLTALWNTETACPTSDVNVVTNSWILISSTTSSFPLQENYSFLRHMDYSDCFFLFTSAFAVLVYKLHAHIYMLLVYRGQFIICVGLVSSQAHSPSNLSSHPP